MNWFANRKRIPAPKALTLCELLNSPESYEGKVYTVRGPAHDHPAGAFYVPIWGGVLMFQAKRNPHLLDPRRIRGDLEVLESDYEVTVNFGGPDGV